MGILDKQLKPIPQGYAQAFGKHLQSQSPLLSGNLYSGVGGGYGNISLLDDDDNDTEVTPSAATTNTPPQVSQVDATKAAHSVGAQSFTDYMTAVNEGRKAYQQLFKESLKRKQALADKKVRSDRSTALANALGSLVNVFTAYGMAKKGDYAPIIAEYDSTPDTELKKSIAARYALENENEGLLMQLVKDRINSEAEIAKGKYERDVKYADAIAKAAIGDAKAAQDLYKWQESEKNKNQRAEADRKQKAEQFKEAEKGRNERAAKRNAVTLEAARMKAQGQLTEGQATFVLGVAQGRQQTHITTDEFGMPRTSIGEATISKTDINALASIYNRLEKEGLNETQMDKAMELYREEWLKNPASAMAAKFYKKVIEQVKVK